MKNLNTTTKVYILIVIVFAILLLAAPFINGQNPLTPRTIKGTYASETVTLTFSGQYDVTATCGNTTVEGTYNNGTTGQNLVIWFDLGENCPEELRFLESTIDDYLIYTSSSDDNGSYLEIDGVKYYKQ